MLNTSRLHRITVHYDPDGLLGSRDDLEDLDREATVSDYAISLSLYIADIYDPISVEVTPVPGSGETAIHIEPDAHARPEVNELRGDILNKIAEHRDLGDFWIASA